MALVPKNTAATFNEFDQMAGMPSIDSFPNGRSEYDYILIGDVEMLLKAQPVSGTKLNIDRHKQQGRDWEHLISKGYLLVPTKFTLLLCKNQLDGVNYFERYYQKVQQQLMPLSVIKREKALDVYHPILSADGITKLVIESRPTPHFIKDQMWEVLVEGYDIRFAKPADKKKNVNKATTPGNSDLVPVTGVAPISSPNPITGEQVLYNALTGETYKEDAFVQSLGETPVYVTPATNMIGAK